MQEKVQQLFDRASELFNFTHNAEVMNRPRWSSTELLLGHSLVNELTKAYKYLLESKPEQALNELNSVIPFVVKNLLSESIDEIMSKSKRVELTKAWIIDTKLAYETWKSEEFHPALKSFLEERKLFSNVESFEHLHPEYINIVDEVIKNGLVKFFRYSGSAELPKVGFQYRVADRIGFSTALPEWLMHVSTTIQAKDEVLVTLFGHIDHEEEYDSSFFITLHYKDSVWLATDRMFFDNPRNKRTRRNKDRDRESHYMSIDLPYEVFHDLPALRASQTGVVRGVQTYVEQIELDRKLTSDDEDKLNQEPRFADLGSIHRNSAWQAFEESKRIMDQRKIGWTSYVLLNKSHFSDWIEGIEFKDRGKIVCTTMFSWSSGTVTIPLVEEILIKPMVELESNQRYYFLVLVEKLIQSLIDAPEGSVQRIMTATDYVEQKLIEGAKLDPNAQKGDDFNDFVGFNDDAKDMFTEMVDSVSKQSTERALSLMSYDLAKVSHEFDRNWIGTSNALETLSRWIVLEEEADVVRTNVVRTLAKSRESSEKELVDRLNDNLPLVMRFLFDHPVNLVHRGLGGFTSNIKLGDDVSAWGMCHWVDHKKEYDLVHFHLNYKHGKTHRGWGSHCHNPGCESPNAVQRYPIGQIRVFHHSQLMLLLGLKDRMELPMYFRNYRHHSLQPYRGNSILNNVHPYAILNDPASRRYPNGITFYIYMCPKCLTRYRKSYAAGSMVELPYNEMDTPINATRPTWSPAGKILNIKATYPGVQI